MKKLSQIKAGALLSYINLGISNFIPIIYTPIMLKLLGQSEYGLFNLANSVVGYLGLLNFGLGSTIIRYIIKYRNEGEYEKEKQVINGVFLLYLLIALLVVVGGGVLAFLAPAIFGNSLTLEELNKIKVLIGIMAFNTALSFPSSVFFSIIISYERFIFSKVLDIISTVLTPILRITLLFIGYKSISMTIASTIVFFFVFVARIVYCYKKLGTSIKIFQSKRELIRDLMDFSFFVFLDSLVDMLFWATDKVLIGAMIGTLAVAVYNIGNVFITIIMSLSIGINSVLVPRINNMVSGGQTDFKGLSKLFIRIGRLQWHLLILVATGFFIFGESFIVFFAGNGYEEAYYIALITMIPLMIPLSQNTGMSILVAMNKHRFRAVLYFIIAVINVISTVIILPYYGIIGAAMCTAVSYVIGNICVINLYYSREIKLDIKGYWKNILSISIIPLVLMTVGRCILFDYSYTGFLQMLVYIALYSLVFLILQYLISMNTYEKNLIRAPIMRVVGKKL